MKAAFADLITELAAALEVATAQLTEDALLVEDLGVDSLGMVELASVLARRGIVLSEAELYAMRTVNDVLLAATEA